MSLPLIPLALMGAGGTIAFPTLRGAEQYRDDTYQNSHDVDLPAGTAAGDLVVVFGFFAASGFGTGIDVATPAGWTRLDYLTVSAFSGLGVYWRIADAPMSSVTIEREPGTDAFTAVCNAYSFSKHSDFAPALSALALTLSTANPNPPDLVLPDDWGGAPHVTWLSCVYKGGTNTTSAFSSGYSDLVTTLDNNHRMMSARRNLRATSEDPGAWTTSASSSAVPFTIAVRGPE